MIVSQTALAEILGVTLRTLTTWQAEGLPVAKRGQRGTAHQYETADVVVWYVQRAMAKATATSPKDRLLELQATETAMRIADRRAQLVEASAVAPAWAGMVDQAAALVPATLDRLVASLAACTDDETRRATLADGLDHYLRTTAQLTPEE